MSEDVFSAERAGFAERLARLTGGSTWRQPMGGYGSRTDMQPEAHALAQALSYARRGPNDIGPELVAAVVLSWPANRGRVVSELAALLLICAGHTGERCRDYLPIIAVRCYMSVTTGIDLPEVPQDMPEVEPRDWMLLTGLGCRALWDACEVTVRRAERAYRSAA